MKTSRLLSTILAVFCFTSLGASLASAQSWTLTSPLYTDTPYSISFNTGSLGHGSSVTIFAQAPGGGSWSSVGGGGGPPGTNPITASGTIAFSVAGTWTIKAVDGTTDTSTTLSQITRSVSGSTTPTTFSVNGPFTYNGSVRSVTITPNPSGATFTSGGTTSATNAGTYTATATATGNYSGSNSNLQWTISKATASVGLTPGSQSVDVGTSITFTAMGSGSGSYTWGGTAGATGSGSTKAVTFNSAGSFTVTVQDPGNANYNPSNVASVTINVATPPSPSAPKANVSLSIIGQGTGTAVLTIDSATYNFTFQPQSGQQWSAGRTSGGPAVEKTVVIGADYPVQVTSSGLTDFVIKARISTWVDPSDRYRVQCGGAYVDSITQGELQNNSFVLSVVRTWAAPFGSIDLSDLEVKGVIRYGLGSNRVGEPAGFFDASGLVKGPGVEWSNANSSKTQAKVPAGYVERVNGTLSFYPNGSYSFDGQFYNFSGATPLVSYASATSGSTTTITRTSGSATAVLEIEWAGETITESTHDGPYPYGPPENNWTIETWAEFTTMKWRIWPWRAPSAQRGGLTERVKTVWRIAQIIGPAGSLGPVNYTDQPVYVEITRRLGPNASDPVASYEKHSFPIGDSTLQNAASIVQYGSGSDVYYGQGRGSVTSSIYAIAPVQTNNGLDGGTYTEYYSDPKLTGYQNNLDGQPWLAIGEPKYVRQSFLDDPVNSSTDLITTNSYGSSLVDGKAALLSSVSKKGSTTIGNSTFSYSTGSLGGVATVTTTVTTSTSSTASLTKVLRNYSRRASDEELQGKPVAVTNFDSTKVSYTYQRGTFTASTGAWAAGVGGPDMLVAELNGKAGSTVTAYLGVALDPLDMDPFRSTATERIVNRDGRVEREASYVYTGGSSFSLLASTYYAYNRLGFLLMKADQPISVDSNDNPTTSGRVLYQAAYDGWRKTSESDEQGITLTYTYDNYDRVQTMTRTAVTDSGVTIPATTTTYAYDPTGRLLSETLSASGETSLVTSHAYDTANRPKTKTTPGNFTTTIDYESRWQTKTTSPGGGTKTTLVYKDGRTRSVTGTAVPDATTTYSIDDASGDRSMVETLTATGQATTTVSDWIGRTKTVSSATWAGTTRVVSNNYNGSGQLTSQDTKVGSTKIAPTHLFTYDSYGRLQREALDANGNGVIDLSTDFGVKESEFAYQQGAPGYGTNWYLYSGQKTWPYDGTNAATSRYASQTYTQVSGLTATTLSHSVSLDFDRNKTESTSTVDRTKKKVTTSSTTAGTNQTLQSVTLNGLAISSTNAQGQISTMGYDGLGRLKTTTDSRNLTTTLAYSPGTTLVQSSTPADGRATSFAYDLAGRVKEQTDNATKKAYFQYDAAGNLTHQWGDTVNPVRYEYNDLGQKTKMHTYRSGTWTGSSLPSGFSGAGDVTTWTYQTSPATGLLVTKTDANGAAYNYEYNDLGQVKKRTDARSWVTNYVYNSLNLLQTVDYSDAVTTDIGRTYDRNGKLLTVTDAAGQRSFAYYQTWTDGSYENQLRDKSALLKSETLPTAYFGSTNNVLNIDYQYSVAGRLNGAPLSFKIGGGSSYTVAYGYDAVLRLNSVTYNGGTPFAYNYHASANMIDTVAQGSGYLRDYDYKTDCNMLDKVKHSWGPWGTLPASQTESRLDYDLVGRRSTEKTQGSGFMAALGRSSDPGVHVDFTYTDKSEIDSSGKYIQPANWSSVGAFLAGTGRDFTYDPIGNRTADQAGSYTPNALNQYTAAPGLGSFSYDANGNMIGDGARTYAYDGENRLITVTQGGSSWSYVYDYLGRRIQKSGTGITTTKFLYDGWNLIAELNTSGAITRRFVWGLDVSGSLQGAGGVGGLLTIDTGSAQYRPIYDASHNVVALFNSSGGFAAAYEYDPFGNSQTVAGTYGASNPFRSATKLTDTETGLVYYGMRYYLPQLGRFINRDPIEERGGLNLYGFCGNDGVNRFDVLGMDGDAFDNLRRTGDPQKAGSDSSSQGDRVYITIKGPVPGGTIIANIDTASGKQGIYSYDPASDSATLLDGSISPYDESWDGVQAAELNRQMAVAPNNGAQANGAAIALPIAVGAGAAQDVKTAHGARSGILGRIFGVFGITVGSHMYASNTTAQARVVAANRVNRAYAEGLITWRQAQSIYAQVASSIPTDARAGLAKLQIAASAVDAGVASARRALEGMTVYRVWGGGSGKWGASWTNVNPLMVENFRDAAGLPPQNNGSFLTIGTLIDPSGVRFRPNGADPIGPMGGGLPELIIIPSQEKVREIETWNFSLDPF